MIQCILIQWLNEQKTEFRIANWNAELTSPEVVGLDPDLEYLVKRTPYAIPDFDPRLSSLVTTQNVGDFDTEYPTLKTWVTEYSLQERSIEEKKISIAESENDANYAIFPTNKHLKYMALALAIIDRKASGLTITPAQQLILDKVQAKAQRIWNNHIAAKAKKTAIDAGNSIDLDTDWEINDPENEES